MSTFSNLKYLSEIENKEEWKDFLLSQNFQKIIEAKKYKKINPVVLSQFANFKIKVSDSYAEKFKFHNLAFLIFVYLKNKIGKKKIMEVAELNSVFELHKNTLRRNLKFLVDLNLIEIQNQKIKVSKLNLKDKKENFVMLNGAEIWKLIFISSVKNAIALRRIKFLISKHKISKKSKNKKCLVSNKYLNLTRTGFLKFKQIIEKMFLVNFKKMFEIVRERAVNVKKIDTETGISFFKKAFEFKSNRYLCFAEF
ncbi:MAGa4850 family ICE element protein [Mycoplasmopsis gallinarum]|uniref:MAGa4850 family ICE element protein n=1 Tax=Mycoplasmopsis gallinarum TaxID=29557 RepID=UPI000489A7F9|nr:hypothetical protein [Mycoplasmopsis gallinarum]